MRTRNQSKRQQASGREDAMKATHDLESKSCTTSQPDTGTLTNISRKAVGRLLKRANSRRSQGTKKQDSYPHYSEPDGTPEVESKGIEKQNVNTKVTCDALLDGVTNSDKKGSTLADGKVVEQNDNSSFPDKEEGTDESDWEDGSIPISDSRDHHLDNLAREVTVEFSESPSPAKQKSIRRVSAEDKELAELVHKVHLLCLIARGRLIDNACDDSLIQASILSLLPKHLLKTAEVPKLTADALTPLVNWFHDNFRLRGPSTTERSFKSSLIFALETREGTAEEVAALSVALFRALNLTARFLSILDVASLKPDVDMSGCSNQDATRRETRMFNSSTLMVARSNLVSMSPVKLSSNKTRSNEDIVHRASPRASKARNDCSDACLTKKDEGSKRKGDLEFEMQLEMALSSTSAGVHDDNSCTNLKDLHSSSSDFSSPLKRMKRIKMEESSVFSQGISTAVGSRKVGPPLYWAEVYCSGENLTGKWVHIDAVNAIIDGEQKVEAAAAACRSSLRYVVAFAGHGAKDVTRRYCMKWYKIASQRINSRWWDAVLAPLKELELGATGGVVHLEVHPENASNGFSSTPKCLPDHTSSTDFGLKKQYGMNNDAESSTRTSRVTTRNSIEDMELETRALTEPLPTNQQAYKNHPLYAIEKWLTKYQILHPKGPILGYCSGHSVYPRTCVQMLHTKHRWLQEGLQVKANEPPAKVVKRSLKLSKVQESEPGTHGEDDDEGTISLYGRWQMEPLCLPHAVNGIVPKNERGQVDVWSEKCLPPGTVHLRLPRVFAVAKRLEIDFAPAMVGFEFRNGHSVPVFEGIVVCTEFEDAILEAYAEEEDRREAEEKKRHENQAISRWYQLLSSIVTRQRLNNHYGVGSSSQNPEHIQQKDTPCGSREDMQSLRCQQGYVQDVKSAAPSAVCGEDHEHVFPIGDQSFDEESSMRTKRCPCGFSVQVEEL